MTPEIEAAIKLLAQAITTGTTPLEAMQLTQAALNLAHTAQVLVQTEHHN